MSTPHHSLGIAALVRCMAALLPALGIPAHGQTPAAAPQTEMQKWIADLDAQWQATFKRDVTDAFTAELDKLKIQYLTSIEAGMNKASSAGDLEGSVVLRNEQKRFAETNEVSAQDDAADPLSVKQLRAGWRTQLARMEKDRATRAKALHAKYDQALLQTQTQLTQRKRIDDALLVKARRDEVATAWLAGIPAAQPKNDKSDPAPRKGDPNSTVPTEKVLPWIYLSDVKETTAKVGHAELVKGKLIYRDQKLLVGGAKPQHCLYAHAPSSIIYDLSGKGYRGLKGKVAITDGHWGEVQFAIIGDKREMWTSGVIKKENPRANPKILRFEVDITGITELELRVDSLGTQDSDHSVWLDPQIGPVR